MDEGISSSRAPGGWSFSDDIPDSRRRPTQQDQWTNNGYATNPPESHSSQRGSSQNQSSPNTPRPSGSNEQTAGSRAKRPKTWKPRTCRICFETVLPTFHPPADNIPGIFQPEPNVTYESEEGRLLRPCKCKGSQRYVHEGCLSKWRHSDPALQARRYWECPTCKYKYHLSRLSWGTYLASNTAQIALTISIFLVIIFTLGFIADPFIDFCLDPYGYFFPYFSTYWDEPPPIIRSPIASEGDEASWFEHFLKGFASLGMLGFFKVMLASPIRLFLRSTSWGGGGRVRPTGRDRLNQLSWIAILIGAVTFAFALWKLVRQWSVRLLEKAGERVMDVQGDDNGDDDDD